MNAIRLSRAFVLTLFAIVSSRAYGQKTLTFSMPESVLLFGSPDFELRVVRGTSVQILKPPAKQGAFNYPALASDGSLVAWGFPLKVARADERRRFTLGISPTAQQEWKTHGDFEDIGAAAFSSDRSRVAFAAVSDRQNSLRVLNLPSGEMATLTQLSGVAERAKLSWSPDGKQLVAEVQNGDQPEKISVADLGKGDVKVIGKGVDPAWSPTGKWIVYFDVKRQKCVLVHPDGTGTRVVRNLGRKLLQYRMFGYGAAWSPDGRQLLLNEMKGEGGNIDVMLLDLASGKVTRKSKDGLPAFGWAERTP